MGAPASEIGALFLARTALLVPWRLSLTRGSTGETWPALDAHEEAEEQNGQASSNLHACTRQSLRLARSVSRVDPGKELEDVQRKSV